MPELPDIVVYIEALQARLKRATLRGLRIGNPFLLRSVTPAPSDVAGLEVRGVRRLGKRIVVGLQGDRFLVLHLMIAGRLLWKEAAAPLRRRLDQAAFDFSTGSLVLTEAGSKRRASLHIVEGVDGETGLAAHSRGGLEVLESGLADFRAALARERHTLKRALTDPRLFSGIGNAYSDEILHRARLSPFRMSDQVDAAESRRLHKACIAVLGEWIARLRREAAGNFPKKVTAFREGMAAHGRFREPCPDCGAPIQRIVYAENECNYCPACQTGGRILADRSLSRLMHDDWPRSLEALEERGLGVKKDPPRN